MPSWQHAQSEVHGSHSLGNGLICARGNQSSRAHSVMVPRPRLPTTSSLNLVGSAQATRTSPCDPDLGTMRVTTRFCGACVIRNEQSTETFWPCIVAERTMAYVVTPDNNVSVAGRQSQPRALTLGLLSYVCSICLSATEKCFIENCMQAHPGFVGGVLHRCQELWRAPDRIGLRCDLDVRVTAPAPAFSVMSRQSDSITVHKGSGHRQHCDSALCRNSADRGQASVLITPFAGVR